MSIIDHLQIPITEREAIPKGFLALTDPINLEADQAMVKSVWSTLRGAEGVLATVDTGAIQFWRRPIKPAYPTKTYAGKVKTKEFPPKRVKNKPSPTPS